MKVEIFSKDGCPYCEYAKDFFYDNGISFKETKLNNPEERKKFYESCGSNVGTVPQIFIDGKRIGGYSELLLQKNDVIGRAAIDFLNQENLKF